MLFKIFRHAYIALYTLAITINIFYWGIKVIFFGGGDGWWRGWGILAQKALQGQTSFIHSHECIHNLSKLFLTLPTLFGSLHRTTQLSHVRSQLQLAVLSSQLIIILLFYIFYQEKKWKQWIPQTYLISNPPGSFSSYINFKALLLTHIYETGLRNQHFPDNFYDYPHLETVG